MLCSTIKFETLYRAANMANRTTYPCQQHFLFIIVLNVIILSYFTINAFLSRFFIDKAILIDTV